MTNVDLFCVTFQAIRAIDQFAVVTVSSGGPDFAVGYGSPEYPVGVSQRDVRSGQSVPVSMLGISRVKVGAAVARGASLVAQSGTGFALTIASGAAHTAAPFGRALTSAASGMLASVFVNPSVVIPNSGAAT